MRAAAATVVGALAISAGASCSRASKPFDSRADAGNGVVDFGSDSGIHACQLADQSRSSVGCEYYAIHMDGTFGADNGCFVAYVANTFDQATHLDVSFDGTAIDLGQYAKIPRGGGRSMAYDDYDPVAGLAPRQVAILFLAGLAQPGAVTPGDISDPVPCPVAPALSALTQVHGTGIGRAFRIRTDYPVVAYQMLPFGGGSAAVTGATLLLPTSVFGTNYLAVNAYVGGDRAGTAQTSMNIVAAQDGTEVTIRPKVAILAGNGVDGADPNAPTTYKLNAGQHLQVTQGQELTGSPIASNKPIGLFAGHPCMDVPVGAPYCDHGEQQIPPIHAMGNEYAAVTHRARTSAPENPPWRIIGAVDGTTLVYEPSVGGPQTVGLGDVVEFRTSVPFTVKSQDADHPFLLVTYMTGASTTGSAYGDADFVRAVPSPQYLDRYIFFTDPTYPETNLVVTRRRHDGVFSDVALDCAGTLGGWAPIGTSGDYEYTRIDLVRHDFQKQGACDNGRHEMTSPKPFGVTVWGWGTSETAIFTGYVSYGYPAGQNVAPLTSIVVPPR